MARKKNENRKSESEVKLEALEKALSSFLKGLGTKGEKILDETKAIEEGLHNINPLQIGHRLTNVRELMGVKTSDKKSVNAKMWKNFMVTRVFRLGFKKATIGRYMLAWGNAISDYPEAFVNEMGSRLYGERVTPEQPFGKYTPFVASFTKKDSMKEEIKDGRKVATIVETIMLTFKPKAAKKAKKKAADFLVAAYDALMENLRRYLVANDTELGGLEAKDVFLTNLTPYLLRGFGCALDYTEQVEVRELPDDYKPFIPLDKEGSAPLGEPEAKPKGRRKSKANEQQPPARKQNLRLVQHEEKHEHKSAEEKSRFAAG